MVLTDSAGHVVVQQDLITSIFGAPWIYLLGITIVVLIIISKFRSKEKRPETQAWWGRLVRRDLVKEELKHRMGALAFKCDYVIYRGMGKLGKAHKYEVVTKKVKRYSSPYGKKKWNDKPSVEDIEIISIQFRNFGIWNWLKSLFGRYEYIMVTPDSAEIVKEKKQIVIDPKVHIIADSTIWTISRFGVMDFIDELNVKADLENTKGFVSDFPRRLSNLDPNQAIRTEGISHIYAEEEKAKKNRVSSWVSGGK